MNFVLLNHSLLIAAFAVGFGVRYALVLLKKTGAARGRYPLIAVLASITYGAIILASIGKLSALMVLRDATICSALGLALEVNLVRLSTRPVRLSEQSDAVTTSS